MVHAHPAVGITVTIQVRSVIRFAAAIILVLPHSAGVTGANGAAGSTCFRVGLFTIAYSTVWSAEIIQIARN